MSTRPMTSRSPQRLPMAMKRPSFRSFEFRKLPTTVKTYAIKSFNDWHQHLQTLPLHRAIPAYTLVPILFLASPLMVVSLYYVYCKPVVDVLWGYLSVFIFSFFSNSRQFVAMKASSLPMLGFLRKYAQEAPLVTEGWDLWGRLPNDDWLFSTYRLTDPDLLKPTLVEAVSAALLPSLPPPVLPCLCPVAVVPVVCFPIGGGYHVPSEDVSCLPAARIAALYGPCALDLSHVPLPSRPPPPV